MSSNWRIDLESWLKTIDVEGSVLDIGGAEKPLQGRTKSWNVDRYETPDIKTGFDLNLSLKGKYLPAQNVFCLETIMYCYDPLAALNNLCWLTEKNLFISNPLEGYPETKPPGMDMNRMSPNWFKKVLVDNRMKLVDMQIVYPHNPLTFAQAMKAEGYKMFRPHASGILIHVQKV